MVVADPTRRGLVVRRRGDREVADAVRLEDLGQAVGADRDAIPGRRQHEPPIGHDRHPDRLCWSASRTGRRGSVDRRRSDGSPRAASGTGRRSRLPDANSQSEPPSPFRRRALNRTRIRVSAPAGRMPPSGTTIVWSLIVAATGTPSTVTGRSRMSPRRAAIVFSSTRSIGPPERVADRRRRVHPDRPGRPGQLEGGPVGGVQVQAGSPDRARHDRRRPAGREAATAAVPTGEGRPSTTTASMAATTSVRARGHRGHRSARRPAALAPLDSRAVTAPSQPSPGATRSSRRSSARLPDLRLLTDEIDRESYRYDETAYLPAGLPGAVALPTTTEQVAELVRIAPSCASRSSRAAPAPACRAARPGSRAR